MFLPFIASNALSSGAEGLRGRQHHITQQYTYTTSKSGLTEPGGRDSFWQISKPYLNQGVDYTHHITTCPRPPDFPPAP